MTPQSESAAGGPLAGVRVIDFTWAWAGPHGVQLLAMLGAEVIKVESMTRLDHSRVRSLMGGAARGGPDSTSLFGDLNAGKLSIRLDLRKEKARDIVRRLARVSDVAMQNMRPGALTRLGLDYEALSKENPAIIMLSSSAVGETGPERTYAGYAPTFAAMSGIADITGYPDGTPIPLSGAVDLRVGTAAAFAVLVALHHRQLTGEGQNIDVSSTEVMSTMMGESFLGYELNGVVPHRMGNRHPRMAPHGCYPCAGVDCWVTIAVGSDTEWEALRSVVADPALDSADYRHEQGRRDHQDRIDEVLAGWTRSREAGDVIAALQEAGVAAGPVLRGETLVGDPHVKARGVLQPLTHPVLGERLVVRPPWQMEGAAIRSAAPLLGQHSDYVLGDLLGMSAEEIEELSQEGVLN